MSSEQLTTLAPNRMPSTGFFDAEYLELEGNNARALVLGLTGVDFTTNLSVTAGHKHDDSDSRITWKQIWTFLLSNGGAGAAVGAAPSECYDAALIQETSFIKIARGRVFLAPIEASQILPRIRVSNDNS